jgi:hypothetical protein
MRSIYKNKLKNIKNYIKNKNLSRTFKNIIGYLSMIKLFKNIKLKLVSYNNNGIR